jgi:hypothetical protein
VTDLDPGTAAFVGAFVAGLFGLAAGLAYVTAPGIREVRGLALVLAAGGVLSLLAGLSAALLIRLVRDRRERGRDRS